MSKSTRGPRGPYKKTAKKTPAKRSSKKRATTAKKARKALKNRVVAIDSTGSMRATLGASRESQPETFKIITGTPKNVRTTLGSAEYDKVVNTLKALVPKKAYFKVDKNMAARIQAIALKGFPEMVVRKSKNPDDTYSVWRES